MEPDVGAGSTTAPKRHLQRPDDCSDGSPNLKVNAVSADGPEDTTWLCKPCTNLNLAQFDPATVDPKARLPPQEFLPDMTGHFFDLDHILDHKSRCRFCGFLFEALCRDVNDPLRTSGSTSIRNDSRLDITDQPKFPFGIKFAEWASRHQAARRNDPRRRPRPFGYTDLDQDLPSATDGSKSNSRSEAQMESEANGNSAGFYSEAIKNNKLDSPREQEPWSVYHKDNISEAIVFDKMREEGVPAALWIIVYGINHPLCCIMDVKLYGASRSTVGDILLFSQFRLRVASPEYSINERLNYGRVIDKTYINLEHCQQWLNRCLVEHADVCPSPGWAITLESPESIRLIDVERLALVEATGDDCDYAALSYVWGAPKHVAQALTLESSNAKLLVTEGSLDHRVGKTIEAAIHITRKLGLRYLWADRLCIEQDNAAEKHQQIAQMDRIYGSAVVTIVAASGEHLDAGIEGVSMPRSADQLYREIIPESRITVLLPIPPQRDLFPWNDRAWTLQERMLSKRHLIFHDGTVDFHCRCGLWHEDMPTDDTGFVPPFLTSIGLSDTWLRCAVDERRQADFGPRLLRGGLLSEYIKVVEQYTARQMTNAADAISAVAGLLKLAITDQQPEGAKRPLLSGLPQEFFDQAVLWQPNMGENVRLRLRTVVDESGAAEFPSWSWAGWEAVRDERGRVSRGGMRYEYTFQIRVNDQGVARKTIPEYDDTWLGERLQGGAEERMRPLLKWYAAVEAGAPLLTPALDGAAHDGHANTSEAPSSSGSVKLVPINGTGDGLILNDGVNMSNWQAAIDEVMEHMDQEVPSLPEDVATKLKPGRHLVFRTQTAQFRLGETSPRIDELWITEFDVPPRPVMQARSRVRETSILDEHGVVVGRVVLPDPDTYQSSQRMYDFILISESQFFGDEKTFEVGKYKLLNVMVIEWMDARPFARRLALGKVSKDAWRAARTGEELVVLG